MSRRAIALVAFSIAAVVVIAACQDYNLNPVGSCLIQPGSKVVPLDNLSTADILFVVDDSQSMTPKQNALAQNFSSFITALANNQKERVANGLSPFDFYIAVTTSSIFDDNSGTPRTTYITDFDTTSPRCDDGVGVEGAPYPAGTFVSYGTNAKVLKFTKDLDWASWGTASVDPRLTELVKQFSGTCPGTTDLCSTSCTQTCVGGNIEVGSCGSNQEQPLEAGKMAIEKVLAGQQPIQAGDFLHSNSKLVVVTVTDEDDCSNPLSNPIRRGDCNANPPNAGTYPLSRYTDFFYGLGRPFGAGVVLSANCSGGSCTPATCNGPGEQDGWAASWRLDTIAETFQSGGYSVVEDSVCNDFGDTLIAIANLVLPPSTLQLASLPAASEITMVRIIDTSGNQRKVCTQATSSSEKTTAGWWFTTDNTPTAATPTCDATGTAVTTDPTRCIYINHASTTNDCEAGAGETYSAEYLGVVPPGGCSDDHSCAEYFTGDTSSSKDYLYNCYQPAGATLRTCLCR